jgi:hypothetical protein
MGLVMLVMLVITDTTQRVHGCRSPPTRQGDELGEPAHGVDAHVLGNVFDIKLHRYFIKESLRLLLAYCTRRYSGRVRPARMGAN